jgi:hypothetical protein
MRTQQHAEPEALRFRGATLDEAMELAEQSLGPRARVVAANHIRRGGIGGFFASDLGVEVSVVLDDETIEAALDRIVEETAMEEREKWRDRTAAIPPIELRPALNSFAAAMSLVDEALVEPAPAPAAAPATVATPAPSPAPAPVATPLVVTSAPAQLATGSSLGSRMERLEAAFASLRAGDALVPVRTRSAGPATATPSRRQVELVVAAADQMVETIARHGVADQLSVRVVLRGSTGAQVEVEAQWGAADALARCGAQ